MPVGPLLLLLIGIVLAFALHGVLSLVGIILAIVGAVYLAVALT